MPRIDALNPKYAPIACSTSGANIIVAAVTSRKIRVLAYVISSSGTVNAKWQSHVAPTDISGLLYEVASTGASAGYNPAGWFETIAGESLDLNLSGSVAVGGHVTYVEV